MDVGLTRRFSLRGLVLSVLVLWSSATADVELDGIDDRAQTTAGFTDFASASTSTIELWYKPVGTAQSASPGSGFCTDGGRMVSGWGSGAEDAPIGIARNGDFSAGSNVLCTFTWDGTDVLQQTTAYTANAWTHLVHVHGGGTLSFYKDGTLVGSTAAGDLAAADLSVVRLNIGFGENPWGNPPAQGVIGQVRIYNVALSAAQIAAIGKSQLRRQGSVMPTGAWNFDDCAVGTSANGFDFSDASGNNRVMGANFGSNTTGMTCRGSTFLSEPWGAY